MIKSYFKGAKGVFLVFDLLDRKSFDDISKDDCVDIKRLNNEF